jgi:signal transduction histidine kinase
MGAAVTKVLAALEGMAMIRLPDGRFTVEGELPKWCGTLRRNELRWYAPFDLDEAFPFLSTFLPDAEKAWAAAPMVRVDSDLWTEVDRAGMEIHLEASAVKIDDARLMVIMRSDRLFRESQTLLQRARELRLTHSALMKELEQKDILVHAIVHDLAAPLHSIIGVLSLLGEQPSATMASKWVDLAKQAALRQRQLITEILDVFAAGDDALGPRGAEGAELDAILAGVIAERAPVARRRDIRLETSAPESLGRVVGDEMRLFRVLTNLLDNALRHSPSGSSVRVSARREEAAIVVCVDDDGPGVPAEVLPRLFEKFARGRDATAGTGLGLFYCRITVENWGGGIGYEPRREGGSRFWVRLRTAQPHHELNAKETGDGEALAAR